MPFWELSESLAQRFSISLPPSWIFGTILLLFGGVLLLYSVEAGPIQSFHASYQLKSGNSIRLIWWLSLAFYLALAFLNQFRNWASNWVILAGLTTLLLGFFAFREDQTDQTKHPWSNWETLFLLIVACSAPILWLLDWNSWKYSMIGDETGFFAFAAKIIDRGIFKTYLLNSAGVFGDNPVMTSAIQALFMKVFGIDGYGWKMSGACFGAACIPALYVFARQRESALRAICIIPLFLFSLQVMIWAKIGKPHLFPLFPLAYTIMFFELREKLGLRAIFLAGASAASGFYFVILGAFAATTYLLCGIFLYSFQRKSFKLLVALAGTALLGWIILAFPILLQTQYFKGLFDKNIGAASLTPIHLLRNTIYGFIAPIQYNNYDHFIFGNILDGASAFLFLVGLCVCIRRRCFYDLLILASSTSFAASIAFYDYPPVTRLVLLSVPWSIVGFRGASFLLEFITSKTAAMTYIALLVGTVGFLNLETIYGTDGKRYLNTNQMIVRLAGAYPELRILEIVPKSWNTDVDNGAYKYLNVSARGVSACSPSLLDELKILQGQENALVVLLQQTALPQNIRSFLEESGLKIISFPIESMADAVPVFPENLKPEVLQNDFVEGDESC